MNHLHTFIEDRKEERIYAAKVANRYNRMFSKSVVIAQRGTAIEHSKRIDIRDILKQYGIKG